MQEKHNVICPVKDFCLIGAKEPLPDGSFCQSFQETIGGSLDRSLSPSTPLTEHSSPPPFPFPQPLPTCTPPINSYHVCM